MWPTMASVNDESKLAKILKIRPPIGRTKKASVSHPFPMHLLASISLCFDEKLCMDFVRVFVCLWPSPSHEMSLPLPTGLFTY